MALYAVTALFGAIAGSRAALAALRQDAHPARNPDATYVDYAGIMDLGGHQVFAHDFEV